MKVATLDLGSNTSVLLIGSLFKTGKRFQMEKDEVFFTRLAENFYPAYKIQKPALYRQELFFKAARKYIDSYLSIKVKTVATQVARLAKNKKDLISLGARYGFDIEILSSLEESQLSYKGALFNLPLDLKNVLVLDIGGASTEFGFKENFYSFPFGSVYLTQAFLQQDPPTPSGIKKISKEVKKALCSLPPFLKKFTLVATAGTPVTLASLQHKTHKVSSLHGRELSYSQVEKWWHKLCDLSIEERTKLKGMPVYRADVMPAGISILKCVMEHFSFTECIVSITGLRYGLLSHPIFTKQ